MSSTPVSRQPSTSCQSCRSARRACKPSSPGGACVRCARQKLSCTGPLPEGRGKGPRKQQGSVVAALRRSSGSPTARDSTEERDTQVQLNFRTNWNLSSQQLSYALSFHLLQIHIMCRRGISNRNFPVDHFERKLGVAKGRSAELSQFDELVATAFMVSGAKHSNHSALVGPRPSPLPNPLRFSSLVPQSTTSTDGLLRRQILTPLLSKLLEHLRRLPIIGVPLAAAREHLAFAALVWKVCGSSDMRMERQRVTGEVVCRAFDLLDLPECVGDAREGILLSLSELARQELVEALVLRQPSAVTINMYRRIFSSEYRSAPFYTLSLPASSSPSPPLPSLQLLVERPLTNIADVVIFHATFASSLSQAPAIERCWSLFQLIVGYFDSTYQRAEWILSTSASGEGEGGGVGEGVWMTGEVEVSVYIAHMTGVKLLWGVHRIVEGIEKKGGGEGGRMGERSRGMLDRALVGLAKHARVRMLTKTSHPQKDLETATALTELLEPTFDDFLEGWGSRFPHEALLLLQMLRYASRNLPDTCRLALRMQAVVDAALWNEEGSPPIPTAETTFPLDCVAAGKRRPPEALAAGIVREALAGMGLG